MRSRGTSADTSSHFLHNVTGTSSHDWRLPTNATANKHDHATVLVHWAVFDCAAGMVAVLLWYLPNDIAADIT